MDMLKKRIEQTCQDRGEKEEELKEKTHKLEELIRENDILQEKRSLIQKENAVFNDNINRCEKIASASRLNLRQNNFLQKEEAYSELLSTFENLTNQHLK